MRRVITTLILSMFAVPAWADINLHYVNEADFRGYGVQFVGEDIADYRILEAVFAKCSR